MFHVFCFMQALESICTPIVTKPKPKVEPPKDEGAKEGEEGEKMEEGEEQGKQNDEEQQEKPNDKAEEQPKENAEDMDID